MTEFLPISSSGHLVLFQGLFGIKHPQLFFDIVLHGGTLAAVILVYLSDIGSILADLYAYLRDRVRGQTSPRFLERSQCRLATWILFGTVITGLMGFILRGPIEPLFGSSLAVGITLMGTGTVLWLTAHPKRSRSARSNPGFWDAVCVGVAQGAALIPGVSRSGVTVSAGLFRGLDRELSARFSFLLMIPATVGALASEWALPSGGTSLPKLFVFAGAVTAFLTGYVSLRLLLGVIKGGKFYRFAYYCWGVGATALVFSLKG